MHAGDVVLVAAPMSKACEPDPGMLVLAGHLSSQGIPARLVDANLMFQRALVDPGHLASFVAGVTEDSSVATSSHRAARRGPAIWASLTEASTYADPKLYRGAIDGLFEVHRLASRALGVRLTPSDFVSADLSPLSSQDLAAVGRAPHRLPTAALLDSAVAAILHSSPRVVGVSATYLSQALHSFALAGLLRGAGYRGLLVLGGALVSSWVEKLRADSPVFEVFDALVAGHGEQALSDMALSASVVDSPGVMSPAHGIWRPEGAQRQHPVSFFPDGSTLPWGQYLAPAPILPMTASRGCYWAKCAFCPEAAADAQPYRPGSVEAMAEAILDARDAHGVEIVHLTDNAVSPAHLRRFARAMRGTGVRWYGFARLERQLAEPGMMEELAEGGCTMLQLGIESASPRLLKLMRKGTDLEVTSRILEAAHTAGVRVYGYFLFGMATETHDEAQLTIEWMRQRAEQLTFLNLAIMNMPMGGDIEKRPDAFGVEQLKSMDAHNDLSLYWGFSGEAQQGRAALRRLVKSARRDPSIRPAIRRTPRGFKSNHAAFVALPSDDNAGS